MRSKPLRPVDPEKFLKAFDAIVSGSGQAVPESGGVDVEWSDGTVRNLRIKDAPETRAMYALMQAFPDSDDDEQAIILARVAALRAIWHHRSLAEFLKRGDEMTMVSHKLIRAAAVCPIRRAFLPGELLRIIRSFSEPIVMDDIPTEDV
jgi:hypothetical protein